MSLLDKLKETSKNKKILIAVIAVLVVGGGTTVGILVHNNADKPSKAEVSSVDDNITAEVDDTTENEKTSSDDEAETTNNEDETESVTTTASEESTENTETEVVSPSSSEEVGGNTENSGGDSGESNVQQPVSTQAPVVTQPPVQTTAKPVQTTVATTKAPASTTTVATQPVVDESNSITRNGYYGKAWDFWSGNTAYCWTSSTHIVGYDFDLGYVALDYEIPAGYYNDFMYVYNNELAVGSNYSTAFGKAKKYADGLINIGRDNVIYTNDLDEDGVCDATWRVWATTDGENYWTL